jgi:hypothetical protein
MSGVVLSGDTSGSVTLTVPSVAGSNTVTVPAGTGTVAVQGVSTNIVSGTAVTSTSGTSIDFTGIPSWVKRITVMFNEVSTSGTSNILVQIGSGSVSSSGYVSTSAQVVSAAATSSASSTAGFVAITVDGTQLSSGHMSITLLGSNLWIESHCIKANTGRVDVGGGSSTLGGALDRVRITTVGGTDTFDAGSINILYE